MYKGFYNLSSAILTHQRNLNVVGNNLVNISTSGYKQEQYTATTFDEVMYSRVGNVDSNGPEIGPQSYIRAGDEIYIDYTQGTLEPTNLPLDFAIQGDGFFAVRGENGEVVYTRQGNFSLDEEGYLVLGGHGQVLSPAGEPIYLGTDNVDCGGDGVIYFAEEGYAIGQIGVYTFENLEELDRTETGMFQGANAQVMDAPNVMNRYLERSNSDLVKQMTDMITIQRSLQSAATISSIYNELMTKSATDVGRMQ